MKGYRFFAALGIFVSVLSCCMLNVCASGTGKTEDLVLRYQQDTGCKCVSVVVLDHGELIYYGDNERLYQIGSMTKAFTGLAIQKLIAGGLLDESGKVSDLEAMAMDTDLVRISRTCIMNTDHLKEIRQVKNSHLEAVLDNDEMLIVSRKYLKDIKKVFQKGCL